MKPKLFLGSSREAIQICRSVQAELDDEFEVTVWDQDVFHLSHSALDSLLSALDSSDAGIFVLRGDDAIIRRNTPELAVRDNVLFELGMFVGRLGRDRALMLMPRGTSTHLPSDLSGLTAAEYDAERSVRDPRASVGPACTKIRAHLARLNLRSVDEPESRRRLDAAMARMSRDLESLFDSQPSTDDAPLPSSQTNSRVTIHLGRAEVQLRFGRIEEADTDTPGSVVALPANEYFDDECITDKHSSLGAFVQHAYGTMLDDFLAHVSNGLAGLPSQRVPRAERRIDNSYGIGQAVFVGNLSASHKVILVSATTERVGIGLRAEPHFLYAAVQGVFEKMNENRMDSVSMPVFGSGHGGMPLPVALLFNLLALRSILQDSIGCHVRRVELLVLRRDFDPQTLLQDVVSRIGSVVT